MELRHLRYFLVVGEEQHYGRASRRLRVAQPALSRQIQDLEEEVGFKLNILGGQRTIESSVPETIAIAQPHGTVTRSTEPRRIREHGVEYVLQLAGRACDNLQHFRGRGLLFQ